MTMLSDDEAAVFDRLVGDLEADPGFSERVRAVRAPRARRRGGAGRRGAWLVLVVVAVVGAVAVLGAPYGPYLAFAACGVALWALTRATAGIDAGAQAARIRSRFDTERMVWRDRPSR